LIAPAPATGEFCNAFLTHRLQNSAALEEFRFLEFDRFVTSGFKLLAGRVLSAVCQQSATRETRFFVAIIVFPEFRANFAREVSANKTESQIVNERHGTTTRSNALRHSAGVIVACGHAYISERKS
jgi:hypothetical protein